MADSENAKSYMMWNYLTWLCIETQNMKWLYDQTTACIEDDHFNNSAYNARIVALKSIMNNELQTLEMEFLTKISKISQASNESFISYLHGLSHFKLIDDSSKLADIRSIVMVQGLNIQD